MHKSQAQIAYKIVLRGSGRILLACFQRLMWPGVFVCVLHVSECFQYVCVLSFVSSQLKFASLRCYLQSPSFLSPPLSRSSSFPSLSPMNRLNFLMSCFYGLLMLIHSSPYALLFHPSISVSLVSFIHPLLLLSLSMSNTTMFISAGTRVHGRAHVHSHRGNTLMRIHI